MKRRVMALFLTLTMLVSMAPAVFAADTGFTDVAADAWYAEAVKWAVDNNITGGIGNGMFGPDQTCTRGQVVTFLWAAAGKPVMENADNPFTDVSASDWYYNAVMWAVSNNITGGTSATTFSPEAPCTRAAVVTFLYAAEGKPAVENAKNDFVDVGSGDWFYAPVMWAVANNITGGIGNGCFGPDHACTRGQIALFLYKASLIGGSDVPEETPAPEIMNVKDAADAIAQLAAADSGYENALSELTEKSTNTIEGHSYYRLQQNYKGIPVYGRTVVCAADENGDVMSVTGNALDIAGDVDLTPTVTMESVQGTIEAYLMQVYGISDSVMILPMTDKELVIYNKDDSAAALAYVLTVFAGDELYEAVVDADIGKVYELQSLVRTEIIQRTYTLGEDEKPVKVNFWHENGTYFMDDRERNIQFYSAGGDKLCRITVFFDADNQPMYYYNSTTEQWCNDKNEKIDSPFPFTYEKAELAFIANDETLNVVETTSKANKLPQDLRDVMIYVASADDMFAERFGRSGWTNDRDRDLSVVYNCGNGSYANCWVGLGMLSLETGAGLDEIVHEFAHTVEQSESAMIYKNESGAIMEALSDIFGELAEYHYYTECDWMMDEGLRNLIDPLLSTEDNMPHPYKYKGEYWQYSADDHGGVHQNSTVISHAAYLMSTDGGGKLTMDELGELWYRAMLMMPSDCDFYECRKLVELAGVSMDFDNHQMECISRAFDAVDVKHNRVSTGHSVFYLHPDGKLNLYDFNGQLYDNYILEMTLNSAYDRMKGVNTTVMPYIRKTVNEAEAFPLKLKWGIYNCKAIDADNPKKIEYFTVDVSYYQEYDHIDLYTDFGGSKVTGDVLYVSDEIGVQFTLAVPDAVVTVYEQGTDNYVDSAAVEDINEGFALTLPYGNYTLEASGKGYITKKIDVSVGAEDVELDIILEPKEVDDSDAYAAYVPVVEQAMIEAKRAMFEDVVESSEWAQGYLADLDDDGIDELLMCYHKEFSVSGGKVSQPVYSLYDYENGKLVKVVERKRLVEAWAGGEMGSAAVVSFDGKPTVMIMDNIGSGGGPGVTHLYNYELYDYPSMKCKYLLGYWQEEGEGGPDEEKFYINNAEVSKASFLADLARCPDLKFSQDGYDFYCGDALSLSELREKLGEKERWIYTQYLLDRGYKNLFPYGDEANAEIYTAYADIDGNGIKDLLLKYTDTEFIGVTGYQTYSALYTIDSETQEVVEVCRYYDGGGSMGGETMSLYRKNAQGDPQLVVSSTTRDGNWKFSDGQIVLDFYGTTAVEGKRIFETGYYLDESSHYWSEIRQAKQYTHYIDEDGCYLRVYSIDEQAVSEETYKLSLYQGGGYTTDSEFFTFKGTYYEPIRTGIKVN